MKRPDWVTYFGDIAQAVSRRSSCNLVGVGALLVKDNRILATGYNGSAPGHVNCCDKPDYCQAKSLPGRKYENCPAVHAETNVLAQCAKYGISAAGSTMYVTKPPCLLCAKLLLASGVATVYVHRSSGDGGVWSLYNTTDFIRFSSEQRDVEVFNA